MTDAPIDPKQAFALLGASDVQPALRPGALVADRYELREPVGEGGMGQVWRTYDSLLGREVAIKFALRARKADLERFAREAELTARMSDPRVVRIHACGSHDDRPFIVYELIPGARELGELIPLWSRAERLTVLAEVAAAVGVLHAHGVVHRDVKPENVLLDASGRVRVVDLGIAIDPETSERLTKTGALVGTPNAMAPEQYAAARDQIGPATDVWALGGLLFGMLYDRPPFQAGSLVEMARQVMNAPPPLPEDASVGPALRSLLRSALAHDPADRPADGAQFARALRAALNDETAGAGSRSWAGLLGVCVVALLAVLGAVFASATPTDLTSSLESPAPAPLLSESVAAPAPRLERRTLWFKKPSRVAFWGDRLVVLGEQYFSIYGEAHDRPLLSIRRSLDDVAPGKGGALLLLGAEGLWQLLPDQTELTLLTSLPARGQFLAIGPRGRIAILCKRPDLVLILTAGGHELERFETRAEGRHSGITWIESDVLIYGQFGASRRALPGGRERWHMPGTFTQAACDASRKRLVLGGSDGPLLLGNLEGEFSVTLKVKRARAGELSDPLARLYRGAHPGSVRGLAITPTGLLVSADACKEAPAELALWDVQNKVRLGALLDQGRTEHLALDPKGERVAVANEARNQVLLLSLETLREGARRD